MGRYDYLKPMDFILVIFDFNMQKEILTEYLSLFFYFK